MRSISSCAHVSAIQPLSPPSQQAAAPSQAPLQTPTLRVPPQHRPPPNETQQSPSPAKRLTQHVGPQHRRPPAVLHRREDPRHAAAGVDRERDDRQLPRRLVAVVFEDLGHAGAQHDEVVEVVEGGHR